MRWHFLRARLSFFRDTTLSTTGQIVIPSEIRERKGLRPGDELEIEERADSVVIRKKARNQGLIRHLQSCPVKSFAAPKLTDNLRPAKF
jgi:AbrB family looped-hinge helix DNA binding protein